MRTTLPGPVPVTFGGRVRALRKFHGMSQTVCAGKVKIKQSSLSDIESGKTKLEDLKAMTLLGLSRALKTDPEFLASGTGDALQFQLVELYRGLSEDGRDALLGKANRLYSEERPNDLGAQPFAPRRRKEKEHH